MLVGYKRCKFAEFAELNSAFFLNKGGILTYNENNSTDFTVFFAYQISICN